MQGHQMLNIRDQQVLVYCMLMQLKLERAPDTVFWPVAYSSFKPV